MRLRVVGIAGGVVGLFLATPLLVVMSIVVATEEHVDPPDESESIDGVVTSPNASRGPIGEPFVFGKVRTYATYHRGGRRMYDSITYVDELRGDPRVTLQTASGLVQVTLGEPMTTWRNAEAESATYGSPAEMPNWRRDWSPPRRARQYVNYVLAVRTGDRLLVDRASGDVWIGGRAGADAVVARRGAGQRVFAIGTVVAAVLSGLVSLALLVLGLRARA